MTVGVLLLLTAMARRKLLALLGFGLLWSAANQYCPINEAAGRNSYEPDEEPDERFENRGRPNVQRSNPPGSRMPESATS